MIGFPFDSRITYDELGEPVYDRAISSQPLRTLIGALFSTGILPNPSNNFLVSADETDFDITIQPGFAAIEGGLKLETEVTELTVDAADTYDRIDSVVLKWDENVNVRECEFYIKKGTPAANPVRPTLTREGSVYEIGLADILVVANSTVLQNANITDTRYEAERCGVISSISEFDTTFIYNQVTSDLADFRSNAEADFTSWTENKQSDYQNWISGQESDFGSWRESQESVFEAWVESLRNILDEETAGHLQLEIEDLDDRVDTVETTVAGYDEEIGGLDTRLTAAEGTISSQGSSITDLSSRMSTAEGTISSHTSQISTTNTNLANETTWSSTTLSSSSWSSSTYTINSQSYYRLQKTVTVKPSSGVVNVMLIPYSSSYSLPSTTDENNFQKLDYVVLDTSSNILYFYAKEKPTSSFSVKCSGVKFA